MLDSPVHAAIKTFEPEPVLIRREIHARPEIAFEAFRAPALVAGKLRDRGDEIRRGLGKTGVAGTISGTGPGPGRAMADALGLRRSNPCI